MERLMLKLSLKVWWYTEGTILQHSVDLCSVMRCELDIRRHLGMIAHVMRDHTVLRAIHMFNGKKLNLQMT